MENLARKGLTLIMMYSEYTLNATHMMRVLQDNICYSLAGVVHKMEYSLHLTQWGLVPHAWVHELNQYWFNSLCYCYKKLDWPIFN